MYQEMPVRMAFLTGPYNRSYNVAGSLVGKMKLVNYTKDT